jgi:hypothetical protein
LADTTATGGRSVGVGEAVVDPVVDALVDPAVSDADADAGALVGWTRWYSANHSPPPAT